VVPARAATVFGADVAFCFGVALRAAVVRGAVVFPDTGARVVPRVVAARADVAAGADCVFWAGWAVAPDTGARAERRAVAAIDASLCVKPTITSNDNNARLIIKFPSNLIDFIILIVLLKV
jgi:hypothetical protein